VKPSQADTDAARSRRFDLFELIFQQKSQQNGAARTRIGVAVRMPNLLWLKNARD
jgi:hypothetical protein